jgi:AcrR family transcriptional regulator
VQTAAVADVDAQLPVATRRRLLDAAVKLFGQYSFAGTSLQMIADELDFTKAAIYYHFRTREELLLALMEPILGEIRVVVENAEAQHDAQAQAQAMLSGYADIVARNRSLAAVTTFDPSVSRVLRGQPEWATLIDRQHVILGGIESAVPGAVTAAVVLTGLAGAASMASRRVDDETLCAHLIEVGRRTLGLPAP